VVKLSIITINLNNKTGLEKTIKSVINQTFIDFEFIIIDGNSSDGSLEVIKHYANNITYWVSENDTGIYNAMNKGITKSLGEYCLFLNSGDSLVDSSVLQQVFSCSTNEDIVSGNIYLISKKNQKRRLQKSLPSSQILFSDLFESSLNHQASFIRRSLFYEYGLYDENYRVISDWLFTIKALGMGNATYRFLDLIISEVDADGISGNILSFYYTENIPALNKILPDRILKDYQSGYIQMVKRIKLNKFTWFLFRVVNKLSLVINKIKAY